MKLLFFSFYYFPDLCAGSFRAHALIEQLLKARPDIEIDVITTLPNRYSKYKETAAAFEKTDRLSIKRIALPAHKSGMVDQSCAFLHFYQESLKYVKGKEYTFVFATSSRLFTAFLGARISRKKNIPLYLDIRDLFIDTLNNVLSKPLNFLLNPFLKAVEKYTFYSAKKINIVSDGFLSYLNKNYPNIKYDHYTNGIDDVFLNYTFTPPRSDVITDKKKILYAGNLGEGQGLHKIIPQLAILSQEDFEFIVIGDGGRKKQLQSQLSELKCTNVTLINPISRKELLKWYAKADVLFMHLNDYDAFLRVLPSKIFEYAATGKPILAGVSGFSAEFIKDNVNNAAVFPACNPTKGYAALKRLTCTSVERSEFINQFKRSTIMKAMANSIIFTSTSNG